jgi:subtilisin-like proprotein convertase family protein
MPNVIASRLLPATLVLILPLSLTPSEARGQAGLREALEKLDRDQDGEVEPEEITPLARPYLEQITRAARMSLSRDNDIEDLQEAARRYYAEKNGSRDRPVRPHGESTVKPFGADDDQPLIPEFGLAEVKYPYTQDDLDFADRTLRSHDRNEDGYIDRREARRERWTHRDPFDDDYNKDGRLSRLELAQRYARRRLLEDVTDELRQKEWRTSDRSRSYSRDRDDDDDPRRDWWRRGSTAWLSSSVLERFDTNRNWRLESHESKELGLPVGQIDLNLDGELSRDELQAYLEPLQEEAGSLTEGIPGWFYELDANRDRQVSLSEFTVDWSEQKMQEFATLDLNSDGLLTSEEVANSQRMMGGSFTNRDAEVLPPGKTIVSEIEIMDDLIIGDLNLQLSITHTNVEDLDAFVTGPDGQRIELFTEIGGRGNNFEDTIFDDQVELPIVKARPPYQGSFLTEAAAKRQPSLSHYTGKNARGVWQLTVRGTRSERFGLLHSWSLIIRPEEQSPGQTVGQETEEQL